MQIRECKSTSEVIDALYGDQQSPNKAFAKLISYRDPATKKRYARSDQHVSNYRSTGVFPADTFLIVKAELDRRHLRAPASLWKVSDPALLKRAS